mmetsp:Transcript_23681/g.18111  ORF Transcript_23681/g.18111 Transcript_23681/m.18111 type:complete len:106 (-) Transcript_23681:785-1102(-)
MELQQQLSLRSGDLCPSDVVKDPSPLGGGKRRSKGSKVVFDKVQKRVIILEEDSSDSDESGQEQWVLGHHKSQGNPFRQQNSIASVALSSNEQKRRTSVKRSMMF